MNKFKILMNGLITENPTFVLLLGMCPALGTTSCADWFEYCYLYG